MRDRRLRKKYNITADEFDQILKKQGGGCAGCGGQGVTRPLHLDHDHKATYVPVLTKGSKGAWTAWAEYHDKLYTVGVYRLKNAAIRAVRLKLKRASVRGVLCFPCNGALRKLRDNPNIATFLSLYLIDHLSGRTPVEVE